MAIWFAKAGQNKDQSLAQSHLSRFCCTANENVFEYCPHKMSPWPMEFDLYDVNRVD